MNIDEFIREIPKVELHIHIEGSLEPELMFECARRNGVALEYGSVEEVRAAYEFSDLQSFLDIYYKGAQVLRTAEDFHAMTLAYLRRAADDNVRHTEMFFDPQTHTERGVAFDTVMEGLRGAQREAEATLGISSELILCFLRHLDAGDAMHTLEEALPHKADIVAVGLDSSELVHPPEKFADVFARARDEGFLTVAHAGEEGPPEYIRQALDLLRVRRIDHGVRCVEDEGLVDILRERAVPLTVCPLSNVKLRVFDRIEDHNLGRLLDLGLLVTVNSDDPAYFGGYVNANFAAVVSGLGLNREHVYRLARNSVTASFLDAARKQLLLDEIDGFMREHGATG